MGRPGFKPGGWRHAPPGGFDSRSLPPSWDHPEAACGSDLELSLIGTTDRVRIGNWYGGASNHIEQFKTADGKVLLDSQVDALVSAMAGFAPPSAGQTTLPAGYQTTRNQVIAASWG